MGEQELNKKLAEWAGFICYWEEGATDGLWQYPNEPTFQKRKNCPDFTQSLDASFEWLVPKLPSYKLDNENPKYHHAYLGKNYSAWSETPALALCLAIEKLIDGEK